MATYVVTVPYVTLKVVDPRSGAWTMRGHYAGTVVSDDDVEAASLRHHLDGGMMAETAAPAAPAEPAEPDEDDADETATKPAKATPAKAKA